MYNCSIKYYLEHFYNNKVQKFPVAFRQWNAFSHVDKSYGTLALLLERWCLKIRIWYPFGMLARRLVGTQTALGHRYEEPERN